MHHPGGVRHLQGIEHREHQGDGVGRRQRAGVMQVPGQRLARHVLEHERGLAVDHIGFKQRGDVRVSEPGDMARLAQPGLHGGTGARPHRLHHLDGDQSVQARIVGQPHRGVHALAQHLAQFVPAQVLRVGRTVAGAGRWRGFHMDPVRFS
ncbi:hypothetical protein D9M69_635400 [compost metagenome]